MAKSKFYLIYIYIHTCVGDRRGEGARVCAHVRMYVHIISTLFKGKWAVDHKKALNAKV